MPESTDTSLFAENDNYVTNLAPGQQGMRPGEHSLAGEKTKKISENCKKRLAKARVFA